MVHLIYKNVASMLLFFALLVYCSSAFSATFVTTEGLEPDKVASIWLIKRFIDKEAHFKFIGKNESVDSVDIPFDMPDAELRRFHTRSTFETILAHYKINDRKLITIGRLIHDMEINTWMNNRDQESIVLENHLLEIINKNSHVESIIDKVYFFLDEYCNKE